MLALKITDFFKSYCDFIYNLTFKDLKIAKIIL